jgi:protein-S-isoprenylcysteine O-methyltransferase Ste14
VNVWALRSRGGGDLERPSDLVTNGAYAWSRNPMYVGWSLMHVGVGLGARSPWMVATWPIAAVLVHGQILREEQWLAARFADAFTTYVDQVPRYGCAPWARAADRIGGTTHRPGRARNGTSPGL